MLAQDRFSRVLFRIFTQKVDLRDSYNYDSTETDEFYAHQFLQTSGCVISFTTVERTRPNLCQFGTSDSTVINLLRLRNMTFGLTEPLCVRSMSSYQCLPVNAAFQWIFTQIVFPSVQMTPT